MSDKTSGAAFPELHPSKDCRYNDKGMTMRDYFAAKAMQGMLSDHTFNATPQETSELSYMMADAMLKAREE